MALLLRKVWGSVLTRSGSTSSSGSRSIRSSSDLGEDPNSSMGAFDLIPTDVFMQILRLLGPREAARSSLVCRAWRALVADNRLWIFFLQNGKEPWDCVVFAETHLRGGSPYLTYYGHTPQLSFMRIYAQRAVIPGSVIVDGGSGYCKFGWSKYSSPSGRSATFLEFGNIESPMYARLHHFFSTIYTRMRVKPSSQPIIVIIPICHCDVFQGKVMREIGVEIVGQGALKLTGFLRELMQQRNMNFESLYTVRTIKEKLCYVAVDYDAELRKDTQALCQIPGEGLFTLSKERFQTGEILFQPQMGGVRAMGLHRAVALCMDHCFNAEIVSDDGWYKTVVLAGGTSCLPGLPERLEKELHKILPPSMSEGVKVLPPPYGVDSAWFGAKIVSNVSTFIDAWCMTKKRFRQKFRRNTSGRTW
ncbi:actin-related protein 8 isoform X2 [Ananas comosus]|uniref:Actin-related protein 8 isoform X2 n=1 Tax=Ananas comosus TaxID=4615 RepID=A0A6P5G2N5_ANACO|nr:actin-related protein 8 isoform X2 [Ananas comosus]